ncbi:hypothetical protein V1264_016704 [Littorina saxatilis]|uniref:Transposable element P transposase-like RNase H domain-containing protein n=1 Tax=Littorina saxatilis TaxID=31220 RepID=A0AAN9GDS5_9CAEN
MWWHPMMLRLAILLHSKSPAAYDTLRKTGILKLPGSSTLREYTTVCESVRGFSEVVMDDLTKVADKLTDENNYVVLLHDEMTVKSDLVFDPRTGKLVLFRLVVSRSSQAQVTKHRLTSACISYTKCLAKRVFALKRSTCLPLTAMFFFFRIRHISSRQFGTI